MDNGKISARIQTLQDKLKEISSIKKETLLYELEAILESGIGKEQRPRLLTDNGSCYISGEFKKFIDEVDLGDDRELPIIPKPRGK